MNEKLRDCVYGFAVGDALGVPFEFRERNTFKCKDMIGFGTHAQPAGTWSDNTSLLLATRDSIRAQGEIDTEDMMHRFCSFLYDAEYTAGGEVFDIGGTTSMAIQRYMYGGVSATQCGGKTAMDNGNGSLMRILPLAFTNATDDDVDAVSSLTHAHEESKMWCRTLVQLARYIIKNGDVSEELKVACRNVRMDEITSTGYVIDTVEAVVWCFCTTETYEECVLTAVNLGGDTDTIAAIAGGLAGIKYGIKSIPGRWLDTVKLLNSFNKYLF